MKNTRLILVVLSIWISGVGSQSPSNIHQSSTPDASSIFGLKSILQGFCAQGMVFAASIGYSANFPFTPEVS